MKKYSSLGRVSAITAASVTLGSILLMFGSSVFAAPSNNPPTANVDASFNSTSYPNTDSPNIIIDAATGIWSFVQTTLAQLTVTGSTKLGALNIAANGDIDSIMGHVNINDELYVSNVFAVSSAPGLYNLIIDTIGNTVKFRNTTGTAIVFSDAAGLDINGSIRNGGAAADGQQLKIDDPDGLLVNTLSGANTVALTAKGNANDGKIELWNDGGINAVKPGAAANVATFSGFSGPSGGSVSIKNDGSINATSNFALGGSLHNPNANAKLSLIDPDGINLNGALSNSNANTPIQVDDDFEVVGSGFTVTKASGDVNTKNIISSGDISAPANVWGPLSTPVKILGGANQSWTCPTGSYITAIVTNATGGVTSVQCNKL